MLVKVVCPNPECKTSFAVAGDVIGRIGRCKKCGKKFPMQGSGSVSPSASLSIEGSRVNAYSVVPEGSQGGTPSFVATPSPRMARRSIPAQFGRYRIKEAIGQGGMGAVYWLSTRSSIATSRSRSPTSAPKSARRSSTASIVRRRPPRLSITPTFARFTTSARSTAFPTSRCPSSRASPCRR